MTQEEKDIHIDLEKARTAWKTVEFLMTFGTLLVVQFLFGKFLISFIGAVVAYAIVNGVLILNIKGLKKKLGL